MPDCPSHGSDPQPSRTATSLVRVAWHERFRQIVSVFATIVTGLRAIHALFAFLRSFFGGL